MDIFYIFYAMIGFGVAIGMVEDGDIEKHSVYGVVFGAGLTGIVWPIYITIKLMQKLSN